MKKPAALSIVSAAIFSILLTAASLAEPDNAAVTAKSVPLSPSDPKETRVGRLIYRGGLELNSSDGRFGGWSGLEVSADGSGMLSQSDEAHWFKAHLLYGKNGNLRGLDRAEIADMRDANGDVIRDKRNGDAEGLAALEAGKIDGRVAVSFERNHRISIYDLSHGLDAKPSAFDAPKEIADLPANEGIESLAGIGDSTLVMIAETARKDGLHPAWLSSYAKGSPKESGAFFVKEHKPYEISDAEMAPDGKHLYLLERHYFGLIGGVGIAVREVDAAQIKPGVTIDGGEIAKFTMHETIDNMEGIALRKSADGKTYVYLMSDDNYNPLQKTLLMMFELAPQ